MTRLWVKCPYCQTKAGAADGDATKPQIVLCDTEEGGCDRYFGVELEIRRIARVSTIDWKREGA